MSNSDVNLSHKSIISRLLCIKMSLRDVLYISYALPAHILKPLIPKALQLATVENDMAFISLVVLKSTRVRLSSFPLFRFNYNQFNIRTYVRDPASKHLAVYFFRSGVTSKIISIATNTIGIPWQFIELSIKSSSTAVRMSLSISGTWEEPFSVKAQNNKNASSSLLFFNNMKSGTDFLIRPLIGFSGDNYKLERFTIQHAEVQPESWSLTELDFPLLKRFVKIDDLNNTHSVFYLPAADFSIFLPPARIKSRE